MSVRNRLIRARRGKVFPEIYANRQNQELEAISKVQSSLSEARSFYDHTSHTDREWRRLRTNAVFKNEADPSLILSIEAFIAEFGVCPKPYYHLCKTSKIYTGWNNLTCTWRRYLVRA